METETLIKTFNIPTAHMGSFKAKIEKLQKKATKIGTPFTFKVLETKEIMRAYSVPDEHGNQVYLPGNIEMVWVCVVELECIRPKIEGYELLGKIEHTAHGNIVSCPVDNSVSDQLIKMEPVCKHCGFKRNRKNTYVMRKEGETEVFLVGKSCLKDFLGHANPEHLAKMAEIISLLEESERYMGDGTSSSGRNTWAVEEVIQHAALFVLKNGWVSSQAFKDSTKSLAMENMKRPYKDPVTKETHLPEPLTEASKELAKKTMEWLDTQEPNSAYIQNLKVCRAQGFVEYRHVGLVVSTVQAYLKAMEIDMKKKYEKKERQVSKHQGKVGEKIVIEGARVVNSFYNEGAWGTTAFYIIKDVHGNFYTWSSSACALNRENTYTLKATVKAHEKYKDSEQTKITRAKIVEQKPDSQVREEQLKVIE